MKINQILNQTILEINNKLMIKEVSRTDKVLLQSFSDVINNGSKLNIKITPAKLVAATGSAGGLWGLFDGERLVGTIALKVKKLVNNVKAGEIGFLFIEKEYLNIKNIFKMYKEVIKNAKKFDIVYVMSSLKNKPINRLLDKFQKVSFITKIKSPMTSSVLNLWISKINNRKIGMEDQKEILIQQFRNSIV